MEIARLVAPGGSVTGIDMDEIKLDRARQAAVTRGLINVEFRLLNVGDWDEPGGYDVVYCRFVLQHLSQPLDLLRRMWAGVRQGGALIAEDADFDGWCCHPPSAAFDFFVRTYRQVLQRRGGDHAMGRKLYACCLAAGIPRPQVAVVQPVWTDDAGKALAWGTLEATRDAIITEGVASDHEVASAVAALQDFTANPDTLISGPRVFQLWSRRP